MSFLEGLLNIFKTKKLPKSDEELLLDEYASIYDQIIEKNLNEYDFLCELYDYSLFQELDATTFTLKSA
ncbi:MAG: hypothetical protein Q3967_00875 [Campylobacter sp.]|nr:hypothetical protein [Campylobacter sp.]